MLLRAFSSSTLRFNATISAANVEPILLPSIATIHQINRCSEQNKNSHVLDPERTGFGGGCFVGETVRATGLGAGFAAAGGGAVFAICFGALESLSNGDCRPPPESAMVTRERAGVADADLLAFAVGVACGRDRAGDGVAAAARFWLRIALGNPPPLSKQRQHKFLKVWASVPLRCRAV